MITHCTFKDQSDYHPKIIKIKDNDFFLGNENNDWLIEKNTPLSKSLIFKEVNLNPKVRHKIKFEDMVKYSSGKLILIQKFGIRLKLKIW